MPSKRREGVTRMRYIVLSQRGSEIVIEKQEIDYIEREQSDEVLSGRSDD